MKADFGRWGRESGAGKREERISRKVPKRFKMIKTPLYTCTLPPNKYHYLALQIYTNKMKSI